MHKVLQWKKTSVLRDWWIWGRIRSRATAHKRWNELSLRWGTHNSILKAVAFISKSLSSKEKICSNNERKIRDTELFWEIPQLLLCQRGKCLHRSQTKSWREQGERNSQNEDKHWYYIYTNSSPECISVKDIQQATLWDKHMQHLKEYIIHEWTVRRNKVTKNWDHTQQSKIIWW